MSDSNIRQSVLALAAGGDDALIEKNFAATEALLEDAANRRELTSSICIEAGMHGSFCSNSFVSQRSLVFYCSHMLHL